MKLLLLPLFIMVHVSGCKTPQANVSLLRATGAGSPSECNLDLKRLQDIEKQGAKARLAEGLRLRLGIASSAQTIAGVQPAARVVLAAYGEGQSSIVPTVQRIAPGSISGENIDFNKINIEQISTAQAEARYLQLLPEAINDAEFIRNVTNMNDRAVEEGYASRQRVELTAKELDAVSARGNKGVIAVFAAGHIEAAATAHALNPQSCDANCVMQAADKAQRASAGIPASDPRSSVITRGFTYAAARMGSGQGSTALLSLATNLASSGNPITLHGLQSGLEEMFEFSEPATVASFITQMGRATGLSQEQIARINQNPQEARAILRQSIDMQRTNIAPAALLNLRMPARSAIGGGAKRIR